MSTCDAKIRPFPNPTEVECEAAVGHEGMHRGVLRDYAHPGSETAIEWGEEDRRTFRGPWAPCDRTPGCVLPLEHHGRCAT